MRFPHSRLAVALVPVLAIACEHATAPPRPATVRVSTSAVEIGKAHV